MLYVVAVRLVSLNLADLGHGHIETRVAEIVRVGLHAKPYCVTTAGVHNKVSIVPERPWHEVSVSQKFEIQIQNFNRFFCNYFLNVFRVENVVRKHLKFEIRL